jgi:hypothetical protein
MKSGVWVLFQGPTGYFHQCLPPKETELNVVLSSWKGEEVTLDDREEIQAVYSKKPTFPGPQNVNLQKQSTRAGLEKIREIAGPDALVLKIRTDMKLDPYDRAIHVLTQYWDECRQLLEDEIQESNRAVKRLSKFSWVLYELRKILGHRQATHPILFLDYSWHRKGYLLDFIQFGRVDDLITLWTLGQKIKPIHFRAPEEYLTKRFLKKFNVGAQGRAMMAAGLFLGKLYNNDVRVTWMKTRITSQNWIGHGLWSVSSQYPR